MSHIVAIDRAISHWVITHRIAFFDTPLWLLSQIADSAVVWVLIALALALSRRVSWAGFGQVVAAVCLASAMSAAILKPLVNRTRPLAIGATALIGRLPGSPSFPSGHATNAFAAAFVLSALYRRGAAVFWALAVLVAFSRVYLGVHYPLDVTVGALVGLCAGVLVRGVAARWSPSLPR